ncbi:MAG: hypothetical protein LBT59_26990 [Clostridiales bacterium]|jgi:molecular chaperone GrpE (heat shock protein)|nr:hypothetical protein [Clostridiales bacterium]
MSTETPVDGAEALKVLAELIAQKLSVTGSIEDFAESVVKAHTGKASEKYNDSFFFDILKPVISRLIRLKDDTAKELRFFERSVAEKSSSNDDTEYAKEILGNLLEDIDSMLLEYDVMPFVSEDTRFNPLRQNAVKTIKTDNPDLFKTVIASLGCGYERRGVVVSKEKVAAYIFVAAEKA